MTTTVQNIRNVCLCGHGGAGKTSLAEAMLYACGVTSRLGKVTDSTSILDYDEDEKERKFTITLATASMRWGDCMINLIDTPGYSDFIGEAISGLSAVETALVAIDLPSGIKVNTRKLWEMATSKNLSKIIVITKVDSTATNIETLISKIQEVFGAQCIPVVMPIGDSVENLLTSQSEQSKKLREALIEKVVETDDALLTSYLDGNEISQETLIDAFRKAIINKKIYPIVAVSVNNDSGIKELLDTIVTILPSAAESLGRKCKKSEEEIPLQMGEGVLCAQFFKSLTDPYVGKLSFFRVYSGTLSAGSTFFNPRTGKNEKAGNIYRVTGKGQEQTPQVDAGEIAAVSKIEQIDVSDTITTPDSKLVMPNIVFPRPMVSLAVSPKARGDEQKISGSLAKVADEDSTFTVEYKPETSELVITGNSVLHLDVMLKRLSKRFNVNVETSTPKIPYKETATTTTESHYRHKKQTGGRGQFGEVYVRVESLPRGSGFEFVDEIVGGAIPGRFVPAVEKGIRESMIKGPLAGYPVEDVLVALYDGSFHTVDSDDFSFRIAGAKAFQEGLLSAKPVLLEPIVDIEISIPSQVMGEITGDLNSRRGRIQGMDSLGDIQVLKAKVPLAEIANYSTELRSITGGEASYVISFSHYDVVPPNVTQAIIEKAKAQKEKEKE
ncbi:MAG: elongation factor G [Planctomycetota bacterium]